MKLGEVDAAVEAVAAVSFSRLEMVLLSWVGAGVEAGVSEGLEGATEGLVSIVGVLASELVSWVEGSPDPDPLVGVSVVETSPLGVETVDAAAVGACVAPVCVASVSARVDSVEAPGCVDTVDAASV